MAQAALAVSSVTLGIDPIRFNADGKIIDFLNPSVARPNTPEERVRQAFGRKLHFDYGYPTELMAFEAPISIGSEEKRADIAIYLSKRAATQRDQSAIRVIIETKAPTIKKGVAQLQSYIFASSAQGGVWINETDAPKYFRRVDVPDTRLDEWPNIPRYGEEWDGVGRHDKAQLRPPHDLVETFRRCHNALYKVGIDSEDLAMDMVRMILAKYRDESNPGDVCEFRCTPLELQSEKGRKQVATRVRGLFEQVRDEHLSVFDKHEVISAGDREVATVVSELQDFRFVPDDDSDDIYDIVGAAYEVYVGAHLKGPRGQYFTPRLVVQLMTRIVAPQEKDLVLDPAMGSGGFLIAAMRYVTRLVNQSKRTANAKRTAIRNVRQHLYGVDKSPKLVKVARTNMILANDGHAGIMRGDSLAAHDELGADFTTRMYKGAPTVILTNPPFGATSEHKITADKEPEILALYQLGHVWRRNAKGKLLPTDELLNEGVPPEYLFVERCVEWLAPGGRIGIVLPRGVLDNDKALSVRTYLLRETRLLAVINCHDDAFKPHTDAKTAILVCEKKESPSDHDDDYPIFMAISQSIGHTGLGEPIFKTDNKGDPIIVNGQMAIDQDLDAIFEAWCAIQEGRPSASEYYFEHTRRGLTEALNLNPVGYLPRYEASRKTVLRMGARDGWTTQTLGALSEDQVFMGSRIARPSADKGVTSGSGIVRYFTGNAVTQTRGENVKYLDLNKAKPGQLRALEQMRLRRGMILITRSGTVGRVVYATYYLDGAIGTDDLIRVVIKDDALRGYVYQFLLSELGQNQLKANVYGAIVDHVEPKDVKQIIVPVPDDGALVKAIGLRVLKGIELQEQAAEQMADSQTLLMESLEADKRDGATARKRLAEAKRDPSKLVRGKALEDELARLES
jgi:type I restriction enzyme M protein